MITIEQIKAARSLLNWNQQELALKSRISLPALKNMERGSGRPRQETLYAVQSTLEDGGIEFISDVGVKLRGERLEVKVFEGADSLYRLLNDVFDTLKGTEEDLLVAGVSETDHMQQGGEKFLELIRKRGKHGIRSKLLSLEGDTNLVDANAPEREYRYVSKEIFSQIPYYVYANKYAILLWGPPQRVVLIESRAVAEAYKEQFMTIWKNANRIKVK